MGYLLAQPGDARGAAVADLGALTSSQMGALTQAAAATNPPTKVEYDKTVVDAASQRTAYNALQADVVTLKNKLQALLDSLQAGSVIAP